MVRDLRHALRRLRSQPGHAAAAVLALALGIGCTTAIFSVMQAVLLRTLPVPHPERMIYLSESQPQYPDASLSGPDFLDLKGQVRSFESVSAFFGMRLVLTGIDRPERVIGSETDGDYFRVLQATALLGRLYGPGSSGEVVLSERLWRRVFGGDPGAIGRTLSVDGAPLVDQCLKRQLLINCTHGNVLRLLPALTLPDALLDEGCGILTEVLLGYKA